MAFSLQFIRKFSNTLYALNSRLPKRSNPGLRNQINAIEDAVEVIQSDPEGFEGLESDLLNAHQSHQQYEHDMQLQREKIRRHLVKNKYFPKHIYPNLLTYAEKEHIRYLHSTDSEEWTVEKLAESFPANAEIISKILKARWTPLSAKRIQAHDDSVAQNWERFNNGEYKGDMSTELYEHFKKFADRSNTNINISHDTLKPLKKTWQKPTSNEFSSIILSLKPKQTEHNSKALSEPAPNIKELSKDSMESETFLLGKIMNKKPITIHELKLQHLSATTSDDMPKDSKNSLDQLAVQELQTSSRTGIVGDKRNSSNGSNAFDYTEKFISSEVVINEFDKKRYGVCPTKERIYIPRKLWRKGATFRANNCYYDDDGEFLYKVPEMTLK